MDQTLNRPKVTEVARCLVACYTGRLINWRATNSGVLEMKEAVPEDGGADTSGARAVLTPDRAEKRQNGRRMKETGEPMFTLTAQDQHGVYLPEEVSGDVDMALPVRNGTKQGYDLAYPGDGVCLSYPKSESRRGRVGKGCSQTLDTGCMMGTVAYAVAMALPESRELLAQMETVWEEFGDSMREAVRGGADDSVPGTAWEDFGDFVQSTAWEDFGNIEKEDAAGEVPGDSGAEPGGDFDFLD